VYKNNIYSNSISRQPFPVKLMIDQKHLENVGSFKYLGSILTNDGRCTCEIKSRNAMARHLLGITKLDKENNQCIREKK
jgi:hypothetical protein